MQRKYWLALSMIEGIGPIRINKLINHFGDPLSIWKADKHQLRKVDGFYKLADVIIKERKRININKILQRLKKLNISYLCLNDPEYPQILKKIYDPPPVLYYKGNYQFNHPCIAIVGSRRCTSYGRKIARALAYKLVQRNITVVSGMARGIDTCGHQGALKGNASTIAVLGSGLDYIYPPENRKLYKKIQEKGLVITEFPPGVEPKPENFPRRNRIISGLSQGVIVVEAAARSGSLITADLALEQGREVFAIPGNIDKNSSKGTNNLIKKGAKIVTCIEDILEELFLDTECKSKKNKIRYPTLNKKEEKIIKILQKNDLLDIDKIVEISGLGVAEVNSLLLKLELKDLIKREAGKKYSFKGLQSLLKPI